MTCKCDDNSDPCASMGGGLNMKQAVPCQSTLMTPQAEADIRAAVRLLKVPFNIGGLAAGASAAPVVIPANSMFRAITIRDLVSTLPNMDDVSITIHSYAAAKPFVDVFGGVFSRGNASDCITGCGRGGCGGPLDAFTITVTNISGAALPAVASLTLQYHIAYPGEPEYQAMCGDCGTGTATSGWQVQKVEP